MGRTNLIVLAVGLGGAIALLMVMQSAMRMQSERSGPSLAGEVRKVLGTRLVGAPVVDEHEIDGASQVEVRVRVLAGADPRRLAVDVGHALWRLLRGEASPSELPDQVIVGIQVADRTWQRLGVPPPWRPRAALVTLPAVAPAKD